MNGNQIIPQYFIDAIEQYDDAPEEILEEFEDDGSEALDDYLSKYL